MPSPACSPGGSDPSIRTVASGTYDGCAGAVRRTKGWVDVDNLWTVVVMVLVAVPLFLGLRYLAARRAIGQARRRRQEETGR